MCGFELATYLLRSYTKPQDILRYLIINIKYNNKHIICYIM